MRKNNEDMKPAGGNFPGSANFTVTGTVVDVYNGRKFDYAKVRTWDENFYRDYDVTVPKEYGVEAQDRLRFDGTIRVYWDEKINRYRLVLQADTVEEVM